MKARHYAALGVPHYWVLDPDQRRLECYTSVDGAFVLSASGEGDAQVVVPVFAGLTIDLALIWR